MVGDFCSSPPQKQIVRLNIRYRRSLQGALNHTPKRKDKEAATIFVRHRYLFVGEGDGRTLVARAADVVVETLHSSRTLERKGSDKLKRMVFATQAALLVVFLISTFTFLFYFLSLRIWLCTREPIHLKHPKWLDGTLRFAAVGRRRHSSSGSKSLIPPWRTHNL
ncbi:hypothetical protein L2E82_11749 [Cichorium intybus]|uniref:Uncharacterized protein n=1 Tax=Cichorium intybus TaxID=13427 RepID=A0ACB9GF67_CICIN|nr:hypothetical protein L2E82_11749 [Cichorium intybus]